MDNLDDILNGNEPIEPEAAQAPQPEETPEAEPEAPEAKAEGQPRGPDGKFVTKGETEPETPEVAPPATEETKIPEAALIGERRRRQDAEAQLEALRQQLQSAQQPQPQFQQPAQAPDMFEDPEGYTSWIEQRAAERATSQAFEQFQYQRIGMAATQFAPSVPDYAEKVQVFQQMAQVNPALMQELYRAANPAEYAYNIAKTQIEINQHGGLEKLIEARVQDALKAQAPKAETPAIPDTLATAQSARGAGGITEPPSLEEILGG